MSHPMHTAANPNWPSDDLPVLTEVSRLLDAGRPADALARVSGGASPWLRNAQGVCLLRLGRPREGVAVLRPLAFEDGGHALRRDVDPTFLANYATALLLDGNDEGFDGVLADIRDRQHPAVVRLLDAKRRWKAGLTLRQRIAVFFGVGSWFVLDVPPGTL